MCSQILISLEGRLKSHPSFTSLLQNNLFRETVFSLLQLVRKQENRDYIMESPFQQTLWKSGVTWQISPELMIVGPTSNQHNVLKMVDTLSFCYGITSSDPAMLITWHQKQKLSLDRSVILAKERSGTGKSTYKFMLNNMQCSMA
jgi:hypothetical protein